MTFRTFATFVLVFQTVFALAQLRIEASKIHQPNFHGFSAAVINDAKVNISIKNEDSFWKLSNFDWKNMPDTWRLYMADMGVDILVTETASPLDSSYTLTIQKARGQLTTEAPQKRFFTSDNAWVIVDQYGIYGLFTHQGESYRLFSDPATGLYQLTKAEKTTFRPACKALKSGTATADEPVHFAKSAQVDCYTVDIMIAADYSMYKKHNSNPHQLENQLLTVFMGVQNRYDNEFLSSIRFQVKGIWLSTCETCDPWNSTNTSDFLLTSFTNWGSNGGFGTSKYDLAALWTDRVLEDNVAGLGWIGGLCNSLRYHVLREYTAQIDKLQTLQAHEIGHNFNADHDALGDSTIMQPRIVATERWSIGSQAVINQFIANKSNSLHCFAPCEAPRAVIDIDGSHIGCAPLQVQLMSGLTNATSWKWTIPGANDTISTLPNPLVTYSKPGVFPLKLEVANSAGHTEAVYQDSIQVKGTPLANYNFTIDQSTRLTTFINASTNYTSVKWVFGDGNVSTRESPLHVFDKPGFYAVSLIVYNDCGADTLKKFLQVQSAPSASFSSNFTTGCEPFLVRFKDESSGDITSRLWSFEGGFPNISTEKTPQVKYDKPGKYKVTLTVSNSAGSNTLTRDTFITVNPRAKGDFIYDNIVGDLDVFFFSELENVSAFEWSFGDGQKSKQANPFHVYASHGTYTVKLYVENGCGKDSIVQVLNIITQPEPRFEANVRAGCTPIIVQFTNKTTNADNYYWSFPGGIPSVSFDENPVVTYAKAGQYNVSLEATNLAGSVMRQSSRYIQVVDPPLAKFSWQRNGLQVLFINTSVGGNQFTWNFGDGQFSQAQMPIHTYAKPGSYTVSLITESFCSSDTLTLLLDVMTSVQEPEWASSLHISPNPTTGLFYLELGTALPEDTDITLVNTLGQTLFQTTWEKGNRRMAIDASKWPGGSYSVVFRTEAALATRRIAIVRR